MGIINGTEFNFMTCECYKINGLNPLKNFAEAVESLNNWASTKPARFFLVTCESSLPDRFQLQWPVTERKSNLATIAVAPTRLVVVHEKATPFINRLCRTNRLPSTSRSVPVYLKVRYIHQLLQLTSNGTFNSETSARALLTSQYTADPVLA